jgi:CubicO group peptidase (beta-lactamase class C family)
MQSASLLLAVLLVPAQGIAATLALTPAQRTGIDAAFKQYKTPGTPGCALGVLRNGTAVYARGYGMADLERNVRITPASVFEVGSTSKQFAAAAIALLVNEGKVSFSDDIHKYIPELPSYGAPLTLNELMWHTSGLRDYTDLLALAGYGLEQATTDEQALSAIVRQRGLEFPSGTQYEYSNTNYFLLSVIVKRVTGETLAQFVRRRIFIPLGMTHTVYRTDYAMLIPDRAMGYAPAGGGRFKNSMSNWQQTGDGGVQISIDDAAKWDANFYNARVGGRRMIDELQTPGHLSNGKRLGYARGLFVGAYRGLKMVSHGGAWIGYRAAFNRFPAVHTSIIVFCNSDAAQPDGLAQQVADVVLAPYLAAPAHADFLVRPVQSQTPARDLIGAYLNRMSGEVFHVAAQRRSVAIEAGGAMYPLTPAGGSTFRLGSTIVRFAIGSDGRATSLALGEGEDATVAQRFTPQAPTVQQLAGAGGSYYSGELDVTWQLRVSGRHLLLEPSRFVPQGAAGPLDPQLPDTFTSDAGGFLIHFTREGNAVTGFTLSAGRGLRSLAFTRVR